MAKSNAAEAMPQAPQEEQEIEIQDSDLEEIEDMTEHAVLEEDKKKKEFYEAAELANIRKNKLDQIPDMTAHAEFVDPADKEAHYQKLVAKENAEYDINESRKKSGYEERTFSDPEAPGQPAPPKQEKKGLLSKLRGLFKK